MTPTPDDNDEQDITLFERAYALLLGAIIEADAGHDVDLAFRVADMVAELDDDPP